MTFMRVQPRQVARAAMHLEGMGLKNHIVVLLSGPMTSAQRTRAKQEIRTNRILAAVEWLCSNNKKWKDVNLQEFRDELKDSVPVVVDRSEEVQSVQENIEERDLFSCFYPDGAMTEQSGGFDDNEAFRDYVKKMEENHYDIELRLKLAKEFCRGSDGDLLVNACLLQFPFGVGGMDELRYDTEGELECKAETEGFLDHLSRLSAPEFQTNMFQLIMYSLFSKLLLLRKSKLSLRGKHTASTLVNGLSSDDISRLARNRAKGNYQDGTASSKSLLDAVDACSRALPHTNEAARTARHTSESMQQHFGMGSVFATVTFDDENSLLIQVMSGNEIDDDTPTDELTEDETIERAMSRRKLRLEYPGLSAINFEMLFNIFMEEVVGWDWRNNKPTDKAGLFGTCLATSVSFEEQGRKSVHGHLTAWIRGYRKVQDNIFFSTDKSETKYSKALARKYCDRLITTEFFSTKKRTLVRAFDHTCTVPKENRMVPKVVGDQQLRNLRHKQGYKATKGKFAYCIHCSKEYTYEDLVNSYIRFKVHLEHIDEVPDLEEEQNENSSNDTEGEKQKSRIPRARMLSEIIQFQKKRNVAVDETPVTCINGNYQHHMSSHVKGCFKCNSQGRAHVCGQNCECRFRLPDRPRAKSTVKELSKPKSWFQWTGEKKEHPMVAFLPQRNQFDLFQNVACRAVSESKFSCNSNLSLVTPGPLGQYQFKYTTKCTQKQDRAEYGEVEETMKKLGPGSRKYEDDTQEATRLIRRAAFAHNSTNIVGAPMASFLLRNHQRFYFSHEFVYCPLKDILRLLNKEAITVDAKLSSDGSLFFENQAFHYLCRSTDLESLSVRQFYEGYFAWDMTKAKKKRKRNGEKTFWRFENTDHFIHPSSKQLKKKKGTYGLPSQCAVKSDKNKLIKVTQWDFPDTSLFRANMLTCPQDQISIKMEQYCQSALSLLMPFRSQSDFVPIGYSGRKPYTNKLREVYNDDETKRQQDDMPTVFTDENIRFLQNLQDCAHNFTRHKVSNDDLQSVTEPYCPPDCVRVQEQDDDSDEEEGSDDIPFPSFFNQLDEDVTDEEFMFLEATMQGYSFDSIMLKRKKQTEDADTVKLPIPTNDCEDPMGAEEDFVEYTVHIQSHTVADATGAGIGHGQKPFHIRDIVEVLLTKTTARAREAIFEYNKGAKVHEANGSIASILEWASAGKLDPLQRRAFEAIISAFLLTFYDEVVDEENDGLIEFTVIEKYRNTKKNLKLLKGGEGTQLICLVHGPGGSGKTTVINLTTAYAREFCKLIGSEFTSRTIVITALSGVAATLLHGETTHSAIGINRRTVEDVDFLQGWDGSRLVIIDEVSFACEGHINKIYKNLQDIKGNTFKPFGGLNMVFAGDFSQLTPPKRDPLYKRECAAFQGTLNAYIELDGMHRFRNDIPWGERLKRFRAGKPTKDDIMYINHHCVVSKNHKPNSNIQVACHYNWERDVVNTTVFQQFCVANAPADADNVYMGAIMILMDSMEMYNDHKQYVPVTSNRIKKHFWTTCGESDCDMDNGRVDPALKMYYNCPLMLTKNEDVPNGQANGSRVFLRKVHVKPGEQPFIIKLHCGVRIRVFRVTQIDRITVKHEMKDMLPRCFDVKTHGVSFKCKMKIEKEKIEVRMKGIQFPLVSNSATTGHKLQGYTASQLLVWNWHYADNWVYVVLSRVREMKGLFLRKPLSLDLTKYQMPDEMVHMLETFSRYIPFDTLSADNYDEMLQSEAAFN